MTRPSEIIPYAVGFVVAALLIAAAVPYWLVAGGAAAIFVATLVVDWLSAHR